MKECKVLMKEYIELMREYKALIKKVILFIVFTMFLVILPNIHIYEGYTLTSIVLGIIFILLLINLAKENNRDWLKLDKLSIEQIVLILTLLIFLAFQIDYTMNYGSFLKILLYIVNYIAFSEAYFYMIKIENIKSKFVLPKIAKSVETMYKPIIIYTIICIANIIIISPFGYFSVEYIIDTILIYAILLLNKLNLIEEMNNINKNIKKMANGNLDVVIEYKNDEFKQLAENINSLNQGMKKAVEESVKAERLKTDLIANVSHDLKTPLTSIINYTDLLNKEKIESPKAKKYIEILKQKSKKLKILTEDLIEISKISSGNEVPNFEKLDFKEMVLQANGEFAEKFEEKNIEIISNFPEENVILNLDSRKMWRVLENLYQNIYKHSLENTRVYVDLISKANENHENIILTIKNISKDKLNISPQELTERFITGDTSRHSGGSGLGLSITKELIMLNKGKMDIQIVGDLFIVQVKFNQISKM